MHSTISIMLRDENRGFAMINWRGPSVYALIFPLAQRSSFSCFLLLVISLNEHDTEIFKLVAINIAV